MFMSTRYMKRPDGSCSRNNQPLFTVDDSLAKLFEYLTAEYSCSKLITPKWKDFRSQKLQFDQKTRLNNAIWRAWHIQYKLNRKARFFQFAAPFSDENAHSFPQAVILDGNDWKTRLDALLRGFRKWRHKYAQSELLHNDVNAQNIKIYDQDTNSSDDGSDYHRKRISTFHSESSKSGKKPSGLRLESNETNRPLNPLETISVLYSIPDTLFTTEDKSVNPCNNLEDLLEFKDTSGMMIQPNLDHLNPCFDELLENVDFLFPDLNVNNNSSKDNNLLLLDGSNSNSNQHFPSVYFHGNNQQASNSNLSNSQNFNSALLSARPEKEIANQQKQKYCADTFRELAPQLQAPNLAAHLQALPPVTKYSNLPNESISSNAMLDTKVGMKRCSAEKSGGTTKRARMKKTSGSFDSKSRTNKSHSEQPKLLMPKTLKPENPQQTNIPIYAQTQIRPKVNTVNPTPLPNAILMPTGQYSGMNTKNPQTTYPIVTSVISYAVVSNVQVATPINATHSTNKLPQQTTFHSLLNAIHTPTPQTTPTPKPSAFETVTNMPTPVNPSDQQLVTLAQLLQTAPHSNTEATLSYLEMLQQQLNLMRKQQQEQLQMKQQFHLQAQKIINQQQLQQLNPNMQTQVNTPNLPQHTSTAINNPNKQMHSSYNETQSWNEKHPLNESKNDNNSGNSYMLMQTEDGKIKITPLNKKGPGTYKAEKQELSNDNEYHQHQVSSILHDSQQKDKQAHLPERQRSFEYLPQNIEYLHQLQDKQQAEFKVRYPKQNPAEKTHQIYQEQSERSQYEEYKKQLNFQPTEISNEQKQQKYLTIQNREVRSSLDSAIALVSLSNSSMDRKQPSLQPRYEHLSSAATTDEEYSEGVSNEDTNDNRRQYHLSAEQKRRGAMKNAYKVLADIVSPNMPSGSSGSGKNKLSTAALLQKTCETIQFYQREQEESVAKRELLKKQIEEEKALISELQNQLPTSGVSGKKDSDIIQKNFFQYCKELIYNNPKSWIFCMIMKPIFESYNKNVTTRSVSEFLTSINRWLDQYCTLPFLRPVVLDTLTNLGTSTKVMEDPNSLVEIAQQVLHEEDPTIIPNNSIQGSHNTR